MSAAEKQKLMTFRLHTFLVGVIILLLSLQAQTMTPLEEEEMSNVSGEGLAFAFDDFRFQMAGTSFFEQVGAEPQGDTVFNRGDLRWIGTTISSGAARSTDDGGTGDQRAYAYHQWDNLDGASECSTAGNPLGCPIAIGGAQGYVEVNNPYVLRVREHEGVGWDGSNWVADFKNQVVELVGATNSDPFRWAFWGEIDALENGSRIGQLQNQEIILGAPVSRLNPNAGDGPENIVGPVFQMYKNWSSDPYANDTLGMLYHHRLSGDYRFSVHQSGGNPGGITNNRNSPDHGNAAYGEVPHFTDREGMYFMNVNTYLPVGQLHYQSMIVGGVGPDDPTGAPEGNFFLELTRIPNSSIVYEDFYALPAGNTTGYVAGAQRWNRTGRYYQTHGYARWGNMFPETGGVSKHRYTLAHDPDGPTYNLANDTHGYNCSSSGGPGINSDYFGSGACNSFANHTVGDFIEPSSDEDLFAEGGMVFLSSGTNSWTLRNNPTRGVNNNLEMLWVNCSSWASNGTCNANASTLERDARYPGNYNPDLEITGVNLGSSRAEGMLINHLKITSLGAAAP